MGWWSKQSKQIQRGNADRYVKTGSRVKIIGNTGTGSGSGYRQKQVAEYRIRF